METDRSQQSDCFIKIMKIKIIILGKWMDCNSVVQKARPKGEPPLICRRSCQFGCRISTFVWDWLRHLKDRDSQNTTPVRWPDLSGVPGERHGSHLPGQVWYLSLLRARSVYSSARVGMANQIAACTCKTGGAPAYMLRWTIGNGISLTIRSLHTP